MVLIELLLSEGSGGLYIRGGSLAWLSADAVTWTVSPSTCKWPLHVVCISSQYGHLEVIRFLQGGSRLQLGVVQHVIQKPPPFCLFVLALDAVQYNF